MTMNLENLNDVVRSQMIEEIERDLANDSIYLSPRLNDSGKANYPAALRAAAAAGTPATFAQELRSGNYFKEYETRNTKHGSVEARVPVTASEILAEGEFNRFYLRGLCRVAIDQGHPAIEVYRAKQVENARSASEAMIGKIVDAEKLLADLREHLATDTALGLPPGPNSGLSGKLTAK